MTKTLNEREEELKQTGCNLILVDNQLKKINNEHSNYVDNLKIQHQTEITNMKEILLIEYNKDLITRDNLIKESREMYENNINNLNNENHFLNSEKVTLTEKVINLENKEKELTNKLNGAEQHVKL